jgi:hypothetical protein
MEIGKNTMVGWGKGIAQNADIPVSATAAASKMAVGAAGMIAGPSIYNTSYANNYNLQVQTNQSPAVVQQSFAMMKLLAG